VRNVAWQGCAGALAFYPRLRHIRARRRSAGPSSDILVLIKAFHSSGDMIADRRADYARRLAETGDYRGAAELVEQALERVPLWTAGWDLLGLYWEKAGDIARAIAAWRHVEALDDAGIFGAQLKLAAHGAASAGASTAVGYVETLFDQYAPRFESALVQTLGYRVPERLDALIGEVMRERAIAAFAEAIDLGCGTGLMGERLRSKVSFLEGIDLSAAMIAETGRKGIYDRLAKAELVYEDLPTVDELLALIDGVTLDDIRDVAAAVLATTPTLAVVGPFDDPGRFEAAVA
jgi:predicted TPR repeat methyltransferase